MRTAPHATAPDASRPTVRRIAAVAVVGCLAVTAVGCDDDGNDAPTDTSVGSVVATTVAGPGGDLQPGSNLSTPSPPTASDVTPPSGAATTVGG